MSFVKVNGKVTNVIAISNTPVVIEKHAMTSLGYPRVLFSVNGGSMWYGAVNYSMSTIRIGPYSRGCSRGVTFNYVFPASCSPWDNPGLCCVYLGMSDERKWVDPFLELHSDMARKPAWVFLKVGLLKKAAACEMVLDTNFHYGGVIEPILAHASTITRYNSPLANNWRADLLFERGLSPYVYRDNHQLPILLAESVTFEF